MMKVLEQAIEKIRHLPEERQAAAAEALELIAAQGDDSALTAEEIEGVKRAQEAVRRGEYASDAKVEEFFARFRS
jgi:phage-related protein